jgi:hypothetical protein
MRAKDLLLAALLLGGTSLSATAAEPELKPNQWAKLDKAELRRGEAPLVWEPEAKRFMVLGGGIGDGYAKPHPFDEVALDLARGEWENWIPKGKEWGPQFGDCKPPAWKTPWITTDAEGNFRPNLTHAISYYSQYAPDPDTKRTYFYFNGITLAYDAAARAWKDLAPANHPNKALGGQLFWSSMCYVPPIKKVLLFGGGNVWTDRGDPGTWTYDPAANVWEELKLDKQPSQRTLSPMVYDPVAKKVVLFGGDQLNQLMSDTWTFDGQKWEERKPELAPAPRAGHALVWLSGAKRVLLLGGYSYESGWGYYPGMYKNRPLEAWIYDTAADKWELLGSWDKDAPPSAACRGADLLRAAAGADDLVAVLYRHHGETGKPIQPWLCRIDASKPDAAGAAKLGVKPCSESGSALLQGKPGAVERRTGFYDPEWYKQKAGPGDPAKTEAELAALAPNTWTLRPQPNRPNIEANEGSAILAPELDLIVNWQGGHCCYGGTAPQVYDLKTDRWSMPFAPEMYLEFCASNGGIMDGWSFTGSPWMPGHPYKSTGYEPESKTMIYCGTEHTFFFDPVKSKWTRAAKPSPFKAYQHVTAFVATPKGVIAWVGFPGVEPSLQLLDAKSREWGKLPLVGKLPGASFHDHSMVYDPKRDRVLLFAAGNKGDVMAYDLTTGATKWLGAAGKDKLAAAVQGPMFQETPYLADCDMVMAGCFRVPGEGGKPLTPLYDCEKNAWFGAELGGTDPVGKSTNSHFGSAMYDPKRKLVWAVNNACQIFVLKFDPKTAKLQKLE